MLAAYFDSMNNRFVQMIDVGKKIELILKDSFTDIIIIIKKLLFCKDSSLPKRETTKTMINTDMSDSKVFIGPHIAK